MTSGINESARSSTPGSRSLTDYDRRFRDAEASRAARVGMRNTAAKGPCPARKRRDDAPAAKRFTRLALQ